MTCTIALQHDNIMYMGSDSCCSDERTISELAYNKIFVKDNKLFGYSGDIRMGQFLQYRFDIPPCSDWDKHKYLCTSFFNSFREGLKNEKLSADVSGEEPSLSALMCWDNNIYTVECNACVVWHPEPYAAIGSGMDYARASLFSTEGLIDDPKKRCILALQAAAKFDLYVRAPFHLLGMRQEEGKASHLILDWKGSSISEL